MFTPVVSPMFRQKWQRTAFPLPVGGLNVRKEPVDSNPGPDFTFANGQVPVRVLNQHSFKMKILD